LWLRISITIAGGAAGVPNVLGVCSALRRVRLVANSGLEIFSVTGPGWFYMLQHFLESEYSPLTGQNVGNSAVANGTFNLDMVIPVCVSMLDFTGLVLVQNEQVLLTLEVDWEADTTVWAAGGATVTGTVTPEMEFFSVPLLPEDRPDLSVAHVILEDTRVIAGAGESIYEPLRTPTYLQLIHGSGFLAAGGADNFTATRLRIEQSNYLFDGDNQVHNMLWRAYHGYARPLGVFGYDWLASSGLGNYGGGRDRVNTSTITAFESTINFAAAGNLTTIRRMLIKLAS
jgi:hypothetical protein